MGILQNFDLTGKVALVTGCRRGIGKGLTLALAEAGADIIGVSHALESGSDIETAVQSLGRKFTPYQCDFSNRDALYDFIAQVKQNHDCIDILVNNAGTNRRAPAAEHPDEYWDYIVDLNLSSQFVITRELGKDMLARGAGKIVFTASLMSFQGGLNHPGYSASKGGVAQLVKALSNEWMGSGVCVNGIAPGYIHTEQTQALRDDKKRGAEILSRIPAGRWGTPEDLAGAVVFLASPASDYVSGTLIAIDGGWLGR